MSFALSQSLRDFSPAIRLGAVSPPLLVFSVVVWVCTVNNAVLWSRILQRFDQLSLSAVGYLLALLGLMVFLLAVPLLLLAPRLILKPVLLFLLGLSGVLSYFTAEMGIVYDVEMVRNVIEAVKDRNTQESLELASASMFFFLLPTTLLPAVWVFTVPVRRVLWWRELLARLVWLLVLVLVIGGLVVMNFKYLSYFSRENNDLQIYLNPFYMMNSAKKLLKRQRKASESYIFRELGEDAQLPPRARRTVGIMVVGETARRGSFSLNGYSRNTNPLLSNLVSVNFRNASSCGTSTAFSVPCMFSFLGEKDYSPETAAQQSNVLDVLQKAGVQTAWIDSNSSCKGVCRRIETIDLFSNGDSDHALYGEGAWYDEIMWQQVDEKLDRSSSDVLLVIHAMGSHGPAYYRRFPAERAAFKPYCQSKAPQSCDSQSIVNAYDNTVHYSDYVIAGLIERLERRHESSFLFYASDHGESLGENGVYLHGLPRIVAPREQTEIAMFAWFSPEYKNSRRWTLPATEVMQVDTAVNHDVVSASLLGLFQVQTDAYEPVNDVFDFQ